MQRRSDTNVIGRCRVSRRTPPFDEELTRLIDRTGHPDHTIRVCPARNSEAFRFRYWGIFPKSKVACRAVVHVKSRRTDARSESFSNPLNQSLSLTALPVLACSRGQSPGLAGLYSQGTPINDRGSPRKELRRVPVPVLGCFPEVEGRVPSSSSRQKSSHLPTVGASLPSAQPVAALLQLPACPRSKPQH